MKRLRTALFWLHLSAGLLAGTIILVMSFTGAVLAFEHEIVTWAERDARRVPAPAADAPRLPLDELLARAAQDAGQPRATEAVVSADPRDAVAVSFGRDAATRYVNPYTGEIRTTTTRTHDFMHLMVDWHRWLARSGDQRAAGKAVTGACNAAFLVLALSGLWIWWPRAWRWSALKPSLWFAGARAKARDWNWHNVYGFWSLPVIVVLTVSGMVISYPWASNLVYRAFGEQPPAQATAPANEVRITAPEDGTPKLGFADALAAIQTATPAWTEITLREGLPRRRAAPQTATTAPQAAGDRPRAESAPRGPQPYSATVKADDGSPVFASSQLVLHPYSGEVLSRSGYADQTPGRKARSWLRYLHTGQALGLPGQLVAGLACVAGCILVYTGFALSWRRFFCKRSADAPKQA